MTASPPAVDPQLARFLRDELGLDDAVSDSPRPVWSFTGSIWIWRGSGINPPPKAAWYFMTIDGDTATTIRTAMGGKTRGFGSARVTATIGETSWQTSIFPSKDSGGYLLPLKASVRRAEGLVDGGTISVALTPA